MNRHHRSHLNSFPRNVNTLEEDYKESKSFVGRRRRSALQIDTTDEGKLSESIKALLDGLLIDE